MLTFDGGILEWTFGLPFGTHLAGVSQMHANGRGRGFMRSQTQKAFVHSAVTQGNPWPCQSPFPFPPFLLLVISRPTLESHFADIPAVDKGMGQEICIFDF